MFGLREAGVWGATVFLAGGVAYFIWRYASSSAEKKYKSRPEACAKKDREEKKRQGEEEERTEEKVVTVAAAPVVAATPEKASEVKRKLNRTHLPKYLSSVCGVHVLTTHASRLNAEQFVFTYWPSPEFKLYLNQPNPFVGMV